MHWKDKVAMVTGASSGLGYLLLSATSQLNTPLAFAALFALSFLGLGVYAIIEIIEVMLGRWLPPKPAGH